MWFRAAGPGDDPRFITGDHGLTWLAHPAEFMQRASHALTDGGGVWVIDPVDAAGLDERLADLGDVTGVVLLLDRHRRDAARLAGRHEVAVHVPRAFGTWPDDLGVPVEQLGEELGGTGFRVRSVMNNRLWREAVLVGDDGDTLIVPEALGTASYYRAGVERVGVHPALRLFPPHRELGDIRPARLLVGHGEPLVEDAAPAIEEALAGARRRAPRAYLGALAGAVRR